MSPSYLSTKKRGTDAISLRATRWSRATQKSQFSVADQGEKVLLGGTQITVSEGHPWRMKYPGRDMGGPFHTVKSEVRCPAPKINLESTNKLQKLDACVLAQAPMSEGSQKAALIPQSLEAPNDLNALGATAIALTNPTSPVADASVTLAESIREGLPLLPGVSTWRDRTRSFLGLPGEFLNAEFGWLPLIGEIRNFAKAVKHATEILSQYKRDEGKLVRREFSFDEIHSESISSQTVSQAPWLGPSPSGSTYGWSKYGITPLGTVTTTQTSKRRSWFSGAFRYYIPTQNDNWTRFMEHGSEADKLFGISLTPEVLWELTPWSWAIDYFSNTQQVLQNLQSIEIYGLIIAYGYMMDEDIQQSTTSWEQTNRSSTSLHPNAGAISYVKTRKLREPASPYGFGLSWGDLSSTQKAILAAVGLSRL